ncbi:MAG TPA: protein kinase [Myxococcaceae bacterium]|jgi:hypothetical protein
MACLTENQLLDHAARRLAPAQARAADDHLDGCPDCRSVLAALVQSVQGESSALSFAGAPPAGGDRERTMVTSGGLTDDLPRGTRMDRYVLLKHVGGGAMGVVYAAFDPRLDRTIAIKLMRIDVAAGMSAESRTRMLREAQAMARLSHPNVVTVHDVGTYAGRLYLAMEYLEQGTLASWLSAGPRPWRAVLGVFVQAGRGLAAAHAHGLVHRDFKPQNVMVGGGRVRITDFGLVRPADALAHPDEPTRPELNLTDAGGEPLMERLTRIGALIGTPRFMAPEQLSGKVADARADQFSFCVALYEALYGTFPFQLTAGVELVRAIQQGRFLRPAAGRRVPGWLRRALVRGLSAAPESRFPSMDALLEALEGGPGRTRGIAIAAAAAVVLIGGTAIVVSRDRQADPVSGEARSVLSGEAEAEALRGEALLREGRWREAEITLLRAKVLAEATQRKELAAKLSAELAAIQGRELSAADGGH